MTLTVNQLAVYNFFAAKQNAQQFDSVDALQAAVDSGTHKPNLLPTFQYHGVSAVTHEIIASLWSVNYGVDFAKVQNGTVIEHYRRHQTKGELKFTNHALDTSEVFERYHYCDNKSIRSGLDGVENQFTTFCDWDSLPDDYKTLLETYPSKDAIFGWSDRSYGKIVYVNKQ